MTTECHICNEMNGGGPGVWILCPRCEGLLRWFRGYFAHEPGFDLEMLTPATTFKELGTDSLDYMHWLIEAEEKLGIKISEREGERFLTVGQFLRHLRCKGAEWPNDWAIQLEKKGGCFSKYRWITVCR